MTFTTIVDAFENVLQLCGLVFTFIAGQPLLMTMAVCFLVVTIISIVSIFIK